MEEIKLPEGLRPVYCIYCKRFLGYESIRRGFALFYCKNCKGWNVIAGGTTSIEKVYKNVKPFLEDLTRAKQEYIMEMRAKAGEAPERPGEGQEGQEGQ